MDDRIRISDADRERVTTRLRDHYAEGRLTLDELDERVTATLKAKTAGELRPIMADLPDLVPAPPPAPQRPQPTAASWIVRRRGPRLLPLLLLGSLAALLIPGAGWLFFAFLKAALLFWLVLCVAGIVLVSGLRRRIRRDRQSDHRHPGWPGSDPRHWRQHSRW
jgi:hypothetical protein